MTVKDHWLDFASKKYDAQLIADMKTVFAIFVLFLPVPIFWSLLVQQVCSSSRRVDNEKGILPTWTTVTQRLNMEYAKCSFLVCQQTALRLRPC